MAAELEIMGGGEALGETGKTVLGLGRTAGGDYNQIRRAYQEKRLRANATTLREEDWKLIDRTLLTVAMAPQVIANYLFNWSGGALRFTFDGFSATLLGRDSISQSAPAEIGMRPSQRTPNSRQVYTRTYIPLPFIYKDYDMDYREVRMSQKQGTPIDASLAADAGFQVGDLVEDAFVNGRSTALVYKSTPLYGLLDFPGTQNVTIGAAWDASGKTGVQIVNDVLEMILASTTKKHYGPWVLFVPDAWRTVLARRCYDYDARNVQQVLKDIDGIQDVLVAPKLPANKPLLIELSPNTVQVAEGMPTANIPWEGPQPYEDLHMKVITMRLARLGQDYDGNCGIIEATVS